MIMLRKWIQAIRVFSFTASILPVFVGAALTLYQKEPIAWGLFPIVIICSILFQAATNLISDYDDFKNGVDQDYTFGSSRVIVEKLLTPGQVRNAAFLAFGIGCLLGLLLVYFRGIPLLMLGIIGLMGGYLYTGKPIGYKYIALGDLCVFILMGPLMVIGSYFTLTGTYHTDILLASLPIGCLVSAILFANNLRDIHHDTEFLNRVMMRVAT